MSIEQERTYRVGHANHVRQPRILVDSASLLPPLQLGLLRLEPPHDESLGHRLLSERPLRRAERRQLCQESLGAVPEFRRGSLAFGAQRVDLVDEGAGSDSDVGRVRPRVEAGEIKSGSSAGGSAAETAAQDVRAHALRCVRNLGEARLR